MKFNTTDLRILVGGASRDLTREALNRCLLLGSSGAAYSSTGSTLTMIRIPQIYEDVIIDIKKLSRQLSGYSRKEIEIDLDDCVAEDYLADSYPCRSKIEANLFSRPQYKWQLSGEQKEIVNQLLTELKVMDQVHFTTGLDADDVSSLWVSHSINNRMLDPIKHSSKNWSKEVPDMRYVLTLDPNLMQRILKFEWDTIEINGVESLLTFRNTNSGVAFGILPFQLRCRILTEIDQKFKNSRG